MITTISTSRRDGKEIAEIRFAPESQEDWRFLYKLNGKKMDVQVFEASRNCLISEQ